PAETKTSAPCGVTATCPPRFRSRSSGTFASASRRRVGSRRASPVGASIGGAGGVGDPQAESRNRGRRVRIIRLLGGEIQVLQEQPLYRSINSSSSTWS